MTSPLWDNIFRKDKRDPIMVALRENVLFQDLSNKELRFVKSISHIRDYLPGEKVFSQGEVGVGMYIIVRGCVNIQIEDYLRPNEGDQRSIPVTRLSRGDFFGELSLVEDNGRRNASAVTHEDTQLIGFFKPDLLEIMNRNPHTGSKIVFRLAEVIGSRLTITTENVAQLRRELQKINSGNTDEFHHSKKN